MPVHFSREDFAALLTTDIMPGALKQLWDVHVVRRAAPVLPRDVVSNAFYSVRIGQNRRAGEMHYRGKQTAHIARDLIAGSAYYRISNTYASAQLEIGRVVAPTPVDTHIHEPHAELHQHETVCSLLPYARVVLDFMKRSNILFDIALDGQNVTGPIDPQEMNAAERKSMRCVFHVIGKTVTKIRAQEDVRFDHLRWHLLKASQPKGIASYRHSA